MPVEWREKNVLCIYSSAYIYICLFICSICLYSAGTCDVPNSYPHNKLLPSDPLTLHSMFICHYPHHIPSSVAWFPYISKRCGPRGRRDGGGAALVCFVRHSKIKGLLWALTSWTPLVCRFSFFFPSWLRRWPRNSQHRRPEKREQPVLYALGWHQVRDPFITEPRVSEFERISSSLFLHFC